MGKLILCVYSIFRFFALIDYYKIVSIVCCAMQWVLVVYLFIYSSMYMLILDS